MPPEYLIVFILATYRITLLFSKENGPKDVFEWVRFKFGVRRDEYSHEVATGFWSELILCPYCFSVWVGCLVTLLVVFIPTPAILILLPFALSGASVFIFKWVGV